MPCKPQIKKQILEFLLLAGAVMILCALPLANRDLAAGHDSLFHMLRIEGLAQALREGAALPVRIYSLLLGGYGYACGLFYPDLFLYPFAVLRAFFTGPEITFKLLLLSCCALQCLTGYLAGRGITKSHTGGLILMVSYSLCQYHLANLFIRSAVGEAQAMIFLPLVVWGLWNLTEEGFTRPWILGLGFFGLLMTHTISLALCGLLAVGWVLARLPRVLKGPILFKGVLTTLAVLALGCYYWLPMLEQFASDRFKATTEPLTNLWENRQSLAVLFSLTEYQGLGLGVLILAVLGLGALLLRRRENRPALVFWLLGLGLSIIQLWGGVWKLLDATPLTSIQFPWRLHQLGQFFFCLGAAWLWARFEGEHSAKSGGAGAKKRALALGAVLVVSAANLALLWPSLPELCNYGENYFENRGETFYLVGQEWVPDGVDIYEFAAEPAAQYTTPDGQAHQGEYLPGGDFALWCQEAGAYGVPKLWYKGYSAVLIPEDGSPSLEVPLHKDGAGRVELEVPEGYPAGRVIVSYTGTSLQKASQWVSLAAALALAGGAVWEAYRKKTMKRKEPGNEICQEMAFSGSGLSAGPGDRLR